MRRALAILELLERVSTECTADENFMGCSYEANKVDTLIEDATKVLKEAINSSCNTCEYYHQKWWCLEIGINVGIALTIMRF